MDSGYNNEGGLETAFHIVSDKMVINYLVIEYMKEMDVRKCEELVCKNFYLMP